MYYDEHRSKGPPLNGAHAPMNGATAPQKPEAATPREKDDIYDTLRWLLREIPVRDAALLRVLIAMRIEADKRTGEVYTGRYRSPAHHVQEVSGISNRKSFDAAISQAKKLDFLRGERLYHRGQRRQGGDKLYLNPRWAHRSAHCPPLNGGQNIYKEARIKERRLSF